MVLNHKKINPNGFQLLKYMQDAAIRLILLYGGSSSGKSYSVAQAVLILTLMDGENTLVMRKVGASIQRTIYEDYRQAAKQLGIARLFRFKDGIKRIDCLLNGSKIDFGGLDDPEKLKGISNYKRVQLEELSEYEEEDYKQVRKRLRGKPGQQIVGTFNPIKETHWIKKSVFDREQWHDVAMGVTIAGEVIPGELTAVKSIRMNAPKSMLNPRTKEVETHAPDTVVIQSTYLNNFWVVGSPDGTYGFYDEQCVADFEKDRTGDPDYYQVYALGEWGVIRTGSEFFNAFNRGRHTAEVQYDPALPIHISVDSNVLPYISVTYWQAKIGSDGTQLYQIGETCAGNPDNTVRKSAKLVARRLQELGYTGKLYLHGDASTRAANNIDDEKRSFHDLFISTLNAEGVEVADMVSNRNPSVAMSGEFINAIWDGTLADMEITISEDCRMSIDDYMSVQKDANGAILKTKVKNKATMQSYEEHGHLSDTLRYAVCDLMRDGFLKFSNRRKRNLYARDGVIRFFNPATPCEYSAKVVYCMPNVGGKFVMVYGGKCGERWHILDTAFAETDSTGDIKARLLAIGCETNVMECADAYFPMVRELRADSSLGIRVMREAADIDRRIAATSDHVRSFVLFHEEKATASEEYSAFMQSLLDYNRDGQNKEASACLSGFVQFVEKNFAG